MKHLPELIKAFARHIGIQSALSIHDQTIAFTVDGQEELRFQERTSALIIDYYTHWLQPETAFLAHVLSRLNQPPFMNHPLTVSLNPQEYLTLSIYLKTEDPISPSLFLQQIDLLFDFRQALEN